jgi:hypothetical protein
MKHHINSVDFILNKLVRQAMAQFQLQLISMFSLYEDSMIPQEHVLGNTLEIEFILSVPIFSHSTLEQGHFVYSIPYCDLVKWGPYGDTFL